MEDDFAPEAEDAYIQTFLDCNKAHMVHTMYISCIYRIDNRDSELFTMCSHCVHIVFTMCSHTGAKQVADRADRADRRGS